MSNSVESTFLAVCVKRMKASGETIGKCCDQLTEEQMWHRGGDYENSIANLLLHLEGNIRQWILHGVDNQPDIRTRDAEFTLDPSMDAATARDRFETTLAEACRVVTDLPHHRLLEITDPQPTGTARYPSVLEAIYQAASHLREHTGQVIVLTKQTLARDLDLTTPRKR